MMHVIRSIRVLGDRSIELYWADDVASTVDFGPVIAQGGVFTPLADESFFEQASLDGRGRVVSWPGDLDVCADALFEMSVVLATP